MKYKMQEGSFFDILLDDRFYHFFDLALTSPPYYTARNYGGNALFNTVLAWENWCFDAVCIISSTVKPNGIVWWNTGSGYKDYHKLTTVYRLVARLEDEGIYLVDEIPWIKTSCPPKNLGNRPYAAWEHNYIFSRNPKEVKYNKDAVRRPYNPDTIKRMQYAVGKLSSDLDGEYGNPKHKMVTPNPEGAVHPNYLMLPQDYSKRPHPAPMSPALANWVIRAYSPEGGYILDPMAGIGTTMIECKKLNRNFFGCELYKEYIDIANLSLIRLEKGLDPYNGLGMEWKSLHEKL